MRLGADRRDLSSVAQGLGDEAGAVEKLVTVEHALLVPRRTVLAEGEVEPLLPLERSRRLVEITVPEHACGTGQQDTPSGQNDSPTSQAHVLIDHLAPVPSVVGYILPATNEPRSAARIEHSGGRGSSVGSDADGENSVISNGVEMADGSDGPKPVRTGEER